jgi:hypothetical protein
MRKISFNLTAVFLSMLLTAVIVTAQPASKTSVPSATFEKIWVDYDVTDAGRKGMRIHTAFKTFGMKDLPSYLQIKFQKRDGTALMDNNGAFDHKDGSVAAFRELKPGFDPADFKDSDVFMPYDELDLSPGKYQLRMDVDVIHEDGRLIQHLTLYDFDYTQPAKIAPVNNTFTPSATFQKIWVDYGVTEAGRIGMRIHTAFKTFGMKGVSSYLQIRFQTRDGKALMDKNGEFDHQDGSVAAFGVLKPAYDPAVFEDFEVFMPYSELDLPSGRHQLKMKVDVIHEDGRLIQHLTLYDFEYIKP